MKILFTDRAIVHKFTLTLHRILLNPQKLKPMNIIETTLLSPFALLFTVSIVCWICCTVFYGLPVLSCDVGCRSLETWPSEHYQTLPPLPESCHQSLGPEMSVEKNQIIHTEALFRAPKRYICTSLYIFQNILKQAFKLTSSSFVPPQKFAPPM